MRKLAFVATIVAVYGGAAHAQTPPSGATIAGTVIDEAGHPVAGADVYAIPDTKRTRTDSAGKFTITGLDGGFYHVRARRLGFMPLEITTDLAKNGHVDLKFELKARPVVLDSVVVQASGSCPTLHFGGFNCRRLHGKGVYLTDDDIDAKGAIELGEVFSGVDGFRVMSAPTRFGQLPMPFPTHGNRCLNALVNGRPYALTNPLPRYANQLLGVEIYALPSEVPDEYQRYVWLGSARETTAPATHYDSNDRCSLVVYWTSFN
jgi:hypothetical protein